MKMQQSTRGIRKSLRFEVLEERRVFDSDDAWQSGAALTLSFAPDGTSVGSHPSALAATFSAFETAQWRDAVLRAFQTWTQHVNVNIGLVSDGGAPFGTPADASLRRFGDIRIGATPMSAETLAVSVPSDESTGGSWSGDMLFNSLGQFPDLDTVFKVALHEAGHVLGLAHNPDPLSPMYLHGPEIEPAPTPADIDQLAALYGARGADRNEQHQNNDSIASATRMGLSDDDPGYDGASPAVSFGSISTAADLDYFELPSVAGYDGPIEFHLQSRGLSLLRAKLTIVDRDGVVLGEATGQGDAGDDLFVTVAGAADSKFYARVESANAAGIFGIGGYALVASFVERQTVAESDVARAVDQAFRLIGYDELSIDDFDLLGFLEQDHFGDLDDDAHSDDDDAESTELKAAVESPALTRYRAIATLTDASDRDVYRVVSAERESPQSLTVTVESLSPGGLIPSATIRDRHGRVVPARLLANGAGLFVLEADGIQSDRQYFVEVASAQVDPLFAVGNYKLAVSFTQSSERQQPLDEGELTPAAPTELHSLYVAKTQLSSWVFASAADAPGGSAWMAIYDRAEKPLFYLAAPIGQVRSATSLLLDPGEYHIEFGIVDAVAERVSYIVSAATISHPIGPPVLDATATPSYTCTQTPGAYCYPGGAISDLPVNIAATPTTPSIEIARPIVTAPIDGWFWSSNLLSTNMVRPGDANGDGLVTSLDALLIINELNLSGPRPVSRPPVVVDSHLDVNQDGLITPLDALLIINELNALPISGEPSSLADALTYLYWMGDAMNGTH